MKFRLRTVVSVPDRELVKMAEGGPHTQTSVFQSGAMLGGP